MSKIEKLISRFKSKPKDFTYNELVTLLAYFGYKQAQGAGSRVVFANEKSGHKMKLHKPHPGNILKRYQFDLIEQELKNTNAL
ncbi:type II toxin-antitoxin system HicA family toxin [Mangrovibacterium marinum]|uniref:HicA-like toxin of HicAB toxin-antitoxin system n=1 Tax=Mangrovibacterium marinum TaxID=1639118 RepID=A0A2T5C369_9BACT|nr:type II toxin-antitoxin system HicA family toxin [Mangrovibacterium marinum]PTN09186.1 HicA-like toxin of HicAB toxin-antitoxin system [Mangrovibacterium marinum]